MTTLIPIVEKTRSVPILGLWEAVISWPSMIWIAFAILPIGGSVALYKITRTNLHPLVTSQKISSVSKALPLVLAALFLGPVVGQRVVLVEPS